MRKQIFLSFALIFSLFVTGSGVMIYNLVRTTDGLRYLIGLHEIEDIRQNLFSSVQRVSAYIYGSTEVFSNHLDEVISNAQKMHNSIRQCNECHHEPAVQAELLETTQMVDVFEEQLSYLVTIVAEDERRHSKQEEVYQASSNILFRVQDMVNRAANTIENKTKLAMDELDRVYILVAVTLATTILLSMVVANYLGRRITRPIDALLEGTRKIADGQLGYRTDFEASGEFKELIDAYNTMSDSLAHKREVEKRHIEELRQTQQQLIEAEKLTALGTMAGGIAHDFNNILCGMIGHLNILARQIPPDEEHLQHIDTIEKSAFRAAELVKQLLTFARQKPMDITTIDLNKIVRDLLVLLESTFDGQISIKTDLDPGLPAVLGDSAQIEQAILNLCVNARDAMPGGGTIAITSKKVVLDANFCTLQHDAEPGSYVMLTVQDTGSGINKRILPRVFDPFFTTKEVGKGTGLGLAMVYGIIKSHNGFCTIESTPSKGTDFRIYIPVAGRKDEKAPPAREPISLDGRTILLVDDEVIVTAMLTDYLEDLGCTAIVAHNGKEAVDIFKQRREEIDLVILDIIMPVMGGRETYQELIKIQPDVLVLVSSGYMMNTETQEILNMGAQGFLQKPYRMDDVLHKISSIMNQAD